MTLRDVFNKVQDHLLTQRKRCSVEGYGTCLYRGKDGLKCAAGALIAEKHYSVAMEGDNATHERVWPALVASGVPDTREAKRLVAALQAVHDDVDPAGWFHALYAVKIASGLADADIG